MKFILTRTLSSKQGNFWELQPDESGGIDAAPYYALYTIMPISVAVIGTQACFAGDYGSGAHFL